MGKFDNVNENKSFRAVYTVNVYTVKWLNWDGSAVKTEQVEYGKDATAPTGTPLKDGATFSGWSSDGKNITADLNIIAQFGDCYTVTWKNWDGTVLKTETIAKGSSATPPSDPTKSDCSFTGWDKEYSNITADTVITATFSDSASKKRWKVTWLNGDGSTLATEDVYDGEDATPPTTTPTSSTGTFLGWSSDGKNITADITITPKFSTGETYTVTWKMDIYTSNGSSGKAVELDKIIKTETVPKNGSASYPKYEAEIVPALGENYHFYRWNSYSSGDDSKKSEMPFDLLNNVTQDITIYGTAYGSRTSSSMIIILEDDAVLYATTCSNDNFLANVVIDLDKTDDNCKQMPYGNIRNGEIAVGVYEAVNYEYPSEPIYVYHLKREPLSDSHIIYWKSYRKYADYDKDLREYKIKEGDKIIDYTNSTIVDGVLLQYNYDREYDIAIATDVLYLDRLNGRTKKVLTVPTLIPSSPTIKVSEPINVNGEIHCRSLSSSQACTATLKIKVLNYTKTIDYIVKDDPELTIMPWGKSSCSNNYETYCFTQVLHVKEKNIYHANVLSPVYSFRPAFLEETGSKEYPYVYKGIINDVLKLLDGKYNSADTSIFSIYPFLKYDGIKAEDMITASGDGVIQEDDGVIITSLGNDPQITFLEPGKSLTVTVDSDLDFAPLTIKSVKGASSIYKLSINAPATLDSETNMNYCKVYEDDTPFTTSSGDKYLEAVVFQIIKNGDTAEADAVKMTFESDGSKITSAKLLFDPSKVHSSRLFIKIYRGTTSTLSSRRLYCVMYGEIDTTSGTSSDLTIYDEIYWRDVNEDIIHTSVGTVGSTATLYQPSIEGYTLAAWNVKTPLLFKKGGTYVSGMYNKLASE